MNNIQLTSKDSTLNAAVHELIVRFNTSMTKEKMEKALKWCNNHLNSIDTNTVMQHLNELYDIQQKNLDESIAAITNAYVETYNLCGRLYQHCENEYFKLKSLEKYRQLLREMVNNDLDEECWLIKDKNIDGIRRRIIHTMINKEKEILHPLRDNYYSKRRA